jgi:uncharacterized protein (TIGR03000 family)
MKDSLAALLAGLALVASAHAGPFGIFGNGIGSAIDYGPYTGGHRYSYATAYHYMFSFNSADSWRRDPIAYPAGIYPYRPYGQPILHRTFPKNPYNPPISVPGEDGLPVLAPSRPPAPVEAGAVPTLQPVPTAVAGTPGVVQVIAPPGAEVTVEKQVISGGSFQTPPLPPGKMQIYSVRARWKEGGRDVEQYRVVGVRGGETAKLTFGPGSP